LRYSNAGHEHPIVIGRGGPPEFLSVPDGFLLGVDEESSYRTMETVLQPGDKLIVYTDGVTEAINSAEELYSHENLMAVVRSCSSLSAEQIATEILESVKQFSLGIPQADDITVLALSFTGAKCGASGDSSKGSA
jgi:sigma-B regulation protein RsbU (phosphoserine phosphatase)